MDIGNISFYYGVNDPYGAYLSPPAVQLLKDALSHLQQCSPHFYDFVQKYIRRVERTRGATRTDLHGFVFFNEAQTFAFPPYIQRTYVERMLIHEARHIEGRGTCDETCANADFPQFIRECAQGIDVTPLYAKPAH